MNMISASSAVVHTAQFQTVSESTYTLPPKTPIVPIVDDREMPIEPHDNYASPIGTNNTAGNHINMTV